ncbi:endonuclease III [Thermoplasmatales archaeon SG8-52-1]|nr:MAG: endonuclease III [Thermoplasmatales archaeon SG8-52-1]
MKNIKNLDEIFKLLRNELEKYNMPVVSHPEWDDIVNTPFTTLISCLLSLRTKDDVTAKASYRLFKKYNTPNQLITVSEKELESLIFPVGFYKTKAKRIKDISKTLLEVYNGEVPDDFNELLRLKGVGRKTANIVMVYGHKKQGFLPIDTHCHKISNRLGWVKTKNPEQTELELKKVLPKKYWDDFNHLFVKFGQTICVPISPFCSKCPIKKYCMQVSITKSR